MSQLGNGQFWAFHPTEEIKLERVPVHYKYMLNLPF
jgi:hypothetical protein